MDKVKRILILARRMKVAERFRRHAESDDEFVLFGSIIDQFRGDVNVLLASLTPSEARDLKQADFSLE